MPNAVHALVDTPREFQLIAALLSYRWRPSSPIIPSVETLARQLGCSASTIRRTVARLEARGLLKREERRADDARQMSNEYRLCGALLAFVTALDSRSDGGRDQAWQGRQSPARGERYEPNDSKGTTKNQPGYGRPKGAERYTGGALGAFIHR